MNDPAGWLLAQIDVDEQLARNAGARDGTTWRHCLDAYWQIVNEDNDVVVYGEGRPRAETADHIARHDPAFTLADLAAKRRIAEMHRGSHECPSFDDNCGWITAEDTCDTWKLLALSYTDRPGYREEWRP